MQENKSGCFFLNTVKKIINKLNQLKSWLLAVSFILSRRSCLSPKCNLSETFGGELEDIIIGRFAVVS